LLVLQFVPSQRKTGLIFFSLFFLFIFLIFFLDFGFYFILFFWDKKLFV